MSLVNRELSLIRTRPGLLRQRSSFLTVVESSRRGVFFSHNSPSNESAPRSLVRGERYSQSLEAQLLHFGRQMKFKSSLWITEKERQDEGLKLRSALEIPFSCPCTEGMKPVAFIVNAAFVEQTDLFFFFMRRPLPVRCVCHGVHWTFTGGQWRAISDSNFSFTWMEKLFACVNHMLSDACPVKASSHHNASAFINRPGREVKSYIRELILPPSTTNGRQTEFFWIDHTSISLHGVALFTDAAWFPLNATAVNPSCMYNADQILLYR
ncbi:hypothetical protein TcBrA4_0029130 [Trypanosoma cruzi]|nr:hypothetical protein TcBrA4_0029130 [Trypanosoma cruzi]